MRPSGWGTPCPPGRFVALVWPRISGRKHSVEISLCTGPGGPEPGHEAACSRAGSAWARFKGPHCAPNWAKTLRGMATPPKRTGQSSNISQVTSSTRSCKTLGLGLVTCHGSVTPTSPPARRHLLGRVARVAQYSPHGATLARETLLPMIKSTLRSLFSGRARGALARPSASRSALARPYRVRSTAVLPQRGSRVPRPGACVHTHAPPRAHPRRAGGATPPRLSEAPRRPGPHLRWR